MEVALQQKIHTSTSCFSENLMFKGISEKPRTMTAVDASNIITSMTINKPVKDWSKTMGDLDI